MAVVSPCAAPGEGWCLCPESLRVPVCVFCEQVYRVCAPAVGSKGPGGVCVRCWLGCGVCPVSGVPAQAEDMSVWDVLARFSVIIYNKITV